MQVTQKGSKIWFEQVDIDIAALLSSAELQLPIDIPLAMTRAGISVPLVNDGSVVMTFNVSSQKMGSSQDEKNQSKKSLLQKVHNNYS